MTESTELAIIEPASVPALFAAGGTDDILDKIEAEALSQIADPTTDKGRKAIASNAAKVARSKTYLDSLGKDLAAGLKAQTLAIDLERRKMRARLDTLKYKVRKPLTDFEDREKARISEILAMVEVFEIDVPPDLPGVLAMIEWIQAIEIGDNFMEFQSGAERAKGSAMWLLTTAKENHEARIAEEKARIERENQERIEREAGIAKEAAARAVAQEMERSRAAAEAQAKRIDAAKKKAHIEMLAREAKLKADAEKAVADARREMDAHAAYEKRKAQQDFDEARRVADEQIAKEQAKMAAFKAEQARIAAAERARTKVTVLKSSRAKVNREILARLVELGVSDRLARKIIGAITNGKIPHVSISYGGSE